MQTSEAASGVQRVPADMVTRMNWLITPCSGRNMQKSAIEEIKGLKAREDREYDSGNSSRCRELLPAEVSPS
jgi:hypothetical protein